jgi:hypothetical protein
MSDNGKVNRRILASLKKTDPLKGLEGAYRTYPTTFYSPDVKRLYLRFFEGTALQVHYVEVIARMEPALGPEAAEKCENHLLEQVTKLIGEVDKAIDTGAALMQANGLTQEVLFLPDGLEVQVRVTSPIMRNYLKLMEKTEQMIGLLETLRIDGVITTAMCDTRRGQLKAQIKLFASASRRIATSLRSRAAAAHKAQHATKPADKTNGNAEAPAVAIDNPGNGTNGANGNGAEHAGPSEIAGNGSGEIPEEAIREVQATLGKRWRGVAEPKQQKRVAV